MYKASSKVKYKCVRSYPLLYMFLVMSPFSCDFIYKNGNRLIKVRINSILFLVNNLNVYNIFLASGF